MATEINTVTQLPHTTTSGPTATGQQVSKRQPLPENGQELPRDDTSAVDQIASSDSVKDDVRQGLKQVVSDLQEYVKNSRREFQFSVHEPTGRVTVKIINSETNEVIREIPPEELLELSRRLQEEGKKGFLLETEA